VNTPTHALVALAVLTKTGERPRNLWVLAGALIPDIAIFLWAPWQRWGLGREWNAVWDQHYFEGPMQTLIALFNSVPIYAAILALAWWQRSTKWGVWIMVFSLAALLHIALDAPVHGHDAYRHFWPLSDWRFHSPLSYWEGDLHARWVSFIEAAFVLISAFVLWRRFPKIWVRIVLGALVAFTLTIAGAQQLAAINIPS
jgi:hypothetical protein